MTKKVAVLGTGNGLRLRALMAAVAATGSQVTLVDPDRNELCDPFKPKEKKSPPRTRKQWYTVDSPEVKRMCR